MNQASVSEQDKDMNLELTDCACSPNMHTGSDSESDGKSKISSSRIDSKSTVRLRMSGLIARILVKGGALITLAVIFTIVGYILIKGIPNIKLNLFEWEYNSENVSMMPAIVNTIVMVVVTLVIAVPIGIGAAVYMVEYVSKGSILAKVIKLAIETLAGVPSIVYGLFGALFFVKFLEFQLSILAGCLTLAIMILPLVMGTTEEALRMVPISYKEGSLALGATRVQTIFKVQLGPATPGILSGVIIAVGRIVGESAALVFTSGTIAKPLVSMLSSGRTLSVHMYVLSGEGFHIEQTYATATVLMVLVLILNGLSTLIAKKLGSKNENE